MSSDEQVLADPRIVQCSFGKLKQWLSANSAISKEVRTVHLRAPTLVLPVDLSSATIVCGRTCGMQGTRGI